MVCHFNNGKTFTPTVPLLAVLVASTALALVVGVLVFVAVARLTGDGGAQTPGESRP